MEPQSSAAPAARQRSLDTVSVWALIVTLVVAMFAFIPSASIPFVATKTSLLAGGALVTLALYVLARLSRGNIILPSLALVGALWLPTLAYLLSAVFSGTSFTRALWGTALEPDTLGFMLVAAFFGTLAALVLRRPEQYRSFLKAGAYAFGIMTAVQVLVVLVGQIAPSVIAPSFAVLGSLNDLAIFLGLGTVSSMIALRFMEVSDRTRHLLTAAIVGALFLIALAGSTLVWVLVALAALGLFVESIMRRGNKGAAADLDEAILVEEEPSEGEVGNNRPLVLPLAVLAVSLFFLIGGALGNALDNSLHVSNPNIRPSWQSTLSVAEKTYAVSPIFGSGPGTFGTEWLKYRNASLNSTVFWNVDFTSGIGFIPTSFATTGILGILAWLGFFGFFLVLGLRMLIRRTPVDSFTRTVSIISFIGTLYLFAVAIFDLPGTIILAFAFVFAGLFVSTMRFASNGRQWGILFSRSPRIGFVIVFALTILLLSSVVAAYATVERYLAAVSLTAASNALAAGQYDAADQAAQNAASFAPNAMAYQIQASVATAQLATIAASTTLSKTAAQQAYQAALSSGINAALTATSIDPTDYQSWVLLGNLYAQAVPLGISGAYDSAKTAYDKAVALNPTNPQIPYVIAQLDIANKDTKSAQDELKQAINLKQDYTAAIFLLSQLEVQDGNVKDALNAALAAAYFTPNDPNILFQVGVLYAAQNDLTNAAAALSAAVDANPQFANARYFLAVVYAKQGDMKDALAQMQAIAALSDANAKAVATQLTSLAAGKDPFPKNLLSASSTPVQ